MADEKKYTAKEAAMAVLAKAQEMFKSSELAKAQSAPVEKQIVAPDGVQKDPNPAAPDMHENGNPAPGALPQNQEKFAAEMKGHLKLAKFVGRMEEKRKSKQAPAAAPSMDKAETGHEKGVHTDAPGLSGEGSSTAGMKARFGMKSGPFSAKEDHKAKLAEMKSMPKPKLPV